MRLILRHCVELCDERTRLSGLPCVPFTLSIRERKEGSADSSGIVARLRRCWSAQSVVLDSATDAISVRTAVIVEE